MHYYKRNIGDYAKKAGRLSILQHGVYNLLIDACYDRERFPTRDEAVDWVWASSAAEEEAVDFVLRKFFTLEDGVYVQQHIKEDLAEYLQKAENNKRIANEREANRKAQSTERARTVHEAPPNHKPLTTNQEPKRQGASVAGEEGGPVGPARAGFESPGSGPGSEAAAAMAAAGLADVSATHPKLLALLAAGMTVAELQAAAVYAVGKGVGFAYALSRAEGQRRDAAALAALPDAPAGASADPDSVDAVQAEAARLGMGRWERGNMDARGVHEPWPVFKARVRTAQAAESEVLA